MPSISFSRIGLVVNETEAIILDSFSSNLFTKVVFPVPDGADITINFPVLSFTIRLVCKIFLIIEVHSTRYKKS